MKNQVFETLLSIMEKKAGKKIEKTDLLMDLGLDSIQYVELIVQIENALQITVPEEKLAFDSFVTVDEFVNFIQNNYDQ